MSRWLKILLLALGGIVLLILVAGLAVWLWAEATYLDFEKDFPENSDLSTLTIDGYTFTDRNGNGALDIYEDDRRPLDERVAELLSLMTVEEKLHLLKGSGLSSAVGRADSGIPGAVGTIVPTPRLGLPTLYLSDGPAGLRIQPTRKGQERTYYCTAFPIGTLLASTWNINAVSDVGRAMGKEALEYGIDVILGPGVNIHRHPLCGRNFEYYSEDPILSGEIGAAMVNGIQSNGVGACVKHFVANNQETERMINDARVSERALREIYLKGFKIITQKAAPWSIMSSYNKVNGVYTSESRELLTDVLRDDWEFEGVVISDWFGGSDAVVQIKAGNDLLEPGTRLQWKALSKASHNGVLTDEEINTAASRILRLILRSRKMEQYAFSNAPDLVAHAQVARTAAAEGMVLLKNEEVLPLERGINIALFGVTSYDFISGGTGSGDVNEAYTVSLEAGLRNAGFEINAAAKGAFDRYREEHRAAFQKLEGMKAMFVPYDPPEWQVPDSVLAVCSGTSDLAIITLGRNSGEGGDRKEVGDFLLTDHEREMIRAVTDAFHASNKNVIVILNIGGVIETDSWKNEPDAILLAWQGGQEGGNAVADILAGDVTPSGRLPMTFPVNLGDHASHHNFPEGGETFSPLDMLRRDKEKPVEELVRNRDYTLYEEGVYVGYRHFDSHNVEVSYPFGYGLSYTKFEYDSVSMSASVDTIHIYLKVDNNGTFHGKEVVQLYVSKPNTTLDRPTNELKAFAKTRSIAPGQSASIHLGVPIATLGYWDDRSGSWQIEKGTYQFRIGSSSRQLKYTIEIEI